SRDLQSADVLKLARHEISTLRSSSALQKSRCCAQSPTASRRVRPRSSVRRTYSTPPSSLWAPRRSARRALLLATRSFCNALLADGSLFSTSGIGILGRSLDDKFALMMLRCPQRQRAHVTRLRKGQDIL